MRPIVPPTVPEGGERVRVCLHSANAVEEIDGLVHVIADWVVAQESLERSTVDSTVRARL